MFARLVSGRRGAQFLITAVLAVMATAAPARPQGVAAIVKAGQALEDAGKLDQAIAEYGKAIAADPAAAEGWLRRGIARDKAAQYDAALKDLDRAIQIDSSNAEAHKGRASVLNGLQRFKEAIAASTRAIDLRRGYSAAYQLRGFAKFRLQDYAGSVEDQSRAIEENPRNWDAFRIRGIARVELGQYREAMADLDRTIKSGIGGANMTHHYRGIARNELGDAGGALEDANRTIELSPSYAGAYLARANYRLALGDRAGAEADYRKCVSLAPEWKPGQAALAKLLAGAPAATPAAASNALAAPPRSAAGTPAASSSRSPSSAALPPLSPAEVPDLDRFPGEAKLLAAFRAAPTPPNREALGRVRFERALQLAETAEKRRDDKTFASALAYAESAVALAPDNYAAWLLLGRLYATIEENPVAADMAEQACRAALQVKPGLPAARLALALVLFRRGSFDRALNEIEPALTANAALATPEVVSMMGWAYIYDLQLDRGITFFRDLSGRNPKVEPLAVGLAVLLHENGARVDAERTLSALAKNTSATDTTRGYAKLLLAEWAKGGAR